MTTKTDIDKDKDRIAALAESLGCFTEEEHLLLSGWTPTTAKNYRKRGDGPPYIRHGRHYFYPRDAYSDYLRSRVKERRAVAVGAHL